MTTARFCVGTTRVRPMNVMCVACGLWGQCCRRTASGPSNDRIPRREMWLAEAIADDTLLWEPGRQREARIEHAVEVAAGMK